MENGKDERKMRNLHMGESKWADLRQMKTRATGTQDNSGWKGPREVSCSAQGQPQIRGI